jgi:hypothetical protein
MSNISSLQEQVRLYREYLEDSISSLGLDEKFEELKAKVAIEYNRIVADIKERKTKVLSSKVPDEVPSTFTIRMTPVCKRPTIEIPNEWEINKKYNHLPEAKNGSFFVANENFKPLPAKYQKQKGLKHD